MGVRYNGKFFRGTLDINFFAYYYGLKANSSHFYRTSASYKIFDDWNFTLGLGWMLYSGGDKDYLKRIADNDRIYFESRFDF